MGKRRWNSITAILIVQTTSNRSSQLQTSSGTATKSPATSRSWGAMASSTTSTSSTDSLEAKPEDATTSHSSSLAGLGYSTGVFDTDEVIGPSSSVAESFGEVASSTEDLASEPSSSLAEGPSSSPGDSITDLSSSTGGSGTSAGRPDKGFCSFSVESFGEALGGGSSLEYLVSEASCSPGEQVTDFSSSTGGSGTSNNYPGKSDKGPGTSGAGSDSNCASSTSSASGCSTPTAEVQSRFLNELINP